LEHNNKYKDSNTEKKINGKLQETKCNNGYGFPQKNSITESKKFLKRKKGNEQAEAENFILP